MILLQHATIWPNKAVRTWYRRKWERNETKWEALRSHCWHQYKLERLRHVRKASYFTMSQHSPSGLLRKLSPIEVLVTFGIVTRAQHLWKVQHACVLSGVACGRTKILYLVMLACFLLTNSLSHIRPCMKHAPSRWSPLIYLNNHATFRYLDLAPQK